MSYWLKLGYFVDAQEAKSDYWLKRKWVSDGPGRDSPRWRHLQQPSHGQTYPPYGPQYEVGDRLVIYVTRLGVCTAIVEVVSDPRWDPDWVDQHAEHGEGNRWGVVTEIKGLWAVSLDAAPSVEDIGVAAASVQRKGHIELNELQYAEAEQLIAGKPTSAKAAAPRFMSADVDIEEGETEGYEIAPRSKIIWAERRESALVRDFQKFLEDKGDEVSRNKLIPSIGSHALYTDLFNKTRQQLIEAKAGASRHDIRMAIGQLADYQRFVPGVTGRAVLLEAKPDADLLDLLDSQKIAAVWRSGRAFTDNADGAFSWRYSGLATDHRSNRLTS